VMRQAADDRHGARLRAMIVALWRGGARPGLAMTAILEARGYEEIEARVASAYDHWVGSEGLSFRGREDAERLGDVVKFHWEAVAKNGEVFGVGLNFLVLAADGRIERYYTLLLGGSRTACLLGPRPSQLFAEEPPDEFRALVLSVRTRWEMP